VGGKTTDQVVEELASELASKMPALLTDENAAPITFSKDAEGTLNSLGTFLSIEMGKFNKLLKKMRSSIHELQRAIKGLVVMSAELDRMYQALTLQRVPDAWSNVGYLSLKPLGSWFKDLLARVEFMERWLERGPPDAFWMSAFFFPQGYMTAALQTYARATRIPIDTLDFRTVVTRMSPEDVDACPPQGVYIYGAFVEGARWDFDEQCLAESKPKETHVYMPVLWLDPIVKESGAAGNVKSREYDCPFYKVSSRAGTLSTTGHSTNFVRVLQLPTGKYSPDHWVRRSVALLSQLDD
jgi:dynein heavy chain